MSFLTVIMPSEKQMTTALKDLGADRDLFGPIVVALASDAPTTYGVVRCVMGAVNEQRLPGYIQRGLLDAEGPVRIICALIPEGPARSQALSFLRIADMVTLHRMTSGGY